ncbi:MAG TPA: glycosyltransferase [Bryobacteraceae bacterium]|nr:glycosyltransferase [Bryobacteraceae bacterium]
MIASDGSTDGTAAQARHLADGRRVRVLAFAEDHGKMAMLNASVPELRGELVVFSDAPAMLTADSLRRLVENFGDPAVGAASSRYTVVQAGDARTGATEDLYWKYQAFLKTQESQLSFTVGAHGHLHAIRVSLYPYPPAAAINDDYLIPLSVLANGYRAGYEPAAVVYEEAGEMSGFGRRVRVMAGNIQQLREIGKLMRPLRPLPFFFFCQTKARAWWRHLPSSRRRWRTPACSGRGSMWRSSAARRSSIFWRARARCGGFGPSCSCCRSTSR